jgi:ATPase subunit of ABC transporter with duplicated ATPase domains
LFSYNDRYQGREKQSQRNKKKKKKQEQEQQKRIGTKFKNRSASNVRLLSSIIKCKRRRKTKTEEKPNEVQKHIRIVLSKILSIIERCKSQGRIGITYKEHWSNSLQECAMRQ